MEIEDDTIQKFWQWFVKNEKILKSSIETKNTKEQKWVVEQLNEHILAIGVFSWDVGLNEEDNWFLMISPNGNEEMMQVCDQIMIDSPTNMKWLFHAGKPAKTWSRQFTVFDENMDNQFIDASPWNFLIFLAADGSLELVIEAKNLPHLDKETTETAADYFVTHELGERARIRHISSLVIVPELDKEDEHSKISVSKLKVYFENLI